MDSALIPIQIIENKIFVIRGQRVMLDSDLAILYEVETKRLNEAIKRNIDRFPEDFMFQLNDDEWNILRSQIATFDKVLRKYKPYVFTEQGVAMLSSVLNSKRAIAVNVQIMRVFVKLRQLAFQPTQEIAELRKLLMLYIEKNDERVDEIIQVLNNLLESPREQKQIGFRTEE
ncbi:MAG: hypothetical protein A2Y25_05390 [Candidatus Melainabacteria bacterium GWF2_37_15]|nr:MAG: hypothetical protein A2Y25_05390 [Candidatus Melainabacteria bacterium GWF2_37_15]